MQPAGTDALQTTNNVGPDKSFRRRSCASAWNALMKILGQAPERERPGRCVQLHLRVRLRLQSERFAFALEHSAPRSQELRSIRISFS
jgi:hypothetical protein